MKNYTKFFNKDIDNIHALTLPQIIPSNAISLHLGYPDPKAFPLNDLLLSAHNAIKKEGRSCLQYCEEIGEENLRETISQTFYSSKNNITKENIIITQGTTESLEILLKLLIADGDIIILEAPSYLWAIRVFKMANANLISIPIDNSGIDVNKVEIYLKELRSTRKIVKFIYTIPDFQNPSGCILSLNRRKELIEIAYKYNALIIEDSAYVDLRYFGDSIPTLFDLDNKNIVIQARTFSKTIAPGIRLGWLAGPVDIIKSLTKMKQTGSCTLVSFIVNDYIKSINYEKNVNLMKQIYRNKCKSIIKSMKKYLPKEITWISPLGGFYTWLKLPSKYDIDRIYNLASLNGLLFLKGSDFYCNFIINSEIRLSFSYESANRIEKGIFILSNLLRE
ncbi:MAG: PLP-dependent aminotransferase family protein [Ignavibacteriales bacterium]|nr:PLP-dependent aminotransferase family protein [Ignavibacteriales bacterium]